METSSWPPGVDHRWPHLPISPNLGNRRRQALLPPVHFPKKYRNAILRAFPYEGDLRGRHLWTEGGVTHCRANWYRQVDGETRITRSLFVHVTTTSDGLVVQDKTVV